MTDAVALPAIERPNGKLYRPQRVVARLLDSDQDMDALVLVTGTHDIERAKALASGLVTEWHGRGYEPVFARTGWWRETIRRHERYWDDDEVRGAAGVMFDVRETAGNPVRGEDEPPW